MDEPTSGLDPLIQQAFYDILKEENSRGATVFFSSHVLSEVQKLSEVTITKSSDTINVKDGKVVYVKHVSKNGKTGYYTAEGGCTASSQTEVAGDVAFTDDLK